jgi:hypothetical protein
MRPIFKIKFDSHRVGFWLRAHRTGLFIALTIGLLMSLLLIQIMLPSSQPSSPPAVPVPVFPVR